MNPTPAPAPVAPIACHRCAARLGASRGSYVELGTARVYQRVVLTCPACGKKRSWRPDAPPRCARP